MKVYNSKRFEGTSIRKVKTDDGKPVALIGVVDDMLAAGMFQQLSGVDGWQWCIIYMDGHCEFFNDREELVSYLKEKAA
jgi:hypothetical protein